MFKIWNWISFFQKNFYFMHCVLNDDVDRTLSLKNVQYIFCCSSTFFFSRTKQMRLKVAIERVECYALFFPLTFSVYFHVFELIFQFHSPMRVYFIDFFLNGGQNDFKTIGKMFEYNAKVSSARLFFCLAFLHLSRSQLWFMNSENKFFFFQRFCLHLL